MPVQKCPMCLEVKPVVDSHLVPTALYAYCRSPDFSPVQVGGGIALPTDRQIHDYLLCQSCEDILNKGGEMWMTPKFCTMERSFPFYEALVSGPVEFEEPDGNLYLTTSNPKLDDEKLLHFAMGIFWKASVHPWRRGRLGSQIDLGDYSDELRAWLLGEREFPTNVCLAVMVSPPLRAQITLNAPWEGERTTCRNFLMHFLGILFIMSVGNRIEAETKTTCFSGHPKRPIVVSEKITSLLEKKLAGAFLSSKKTNAYLKFKRRRDDYLKE